MANGRFVTKSAIRSVPMAMVGVRHMRVVVHERRVAMSMAVRLAQWDLWPVLVPVMIVVLVQMLVLQLVVPVFVGMPLA